MPQHRLIFFISTEGQLIGNGSFLNLTKKSFQSYYLGYNRSFNLSSLNSKSSWVIFCLKTRKPKNSNGLLFFLSPYKRLKNNNECEITFYLKHFTSLYRGLRIKSYNQLLLCASFSLFSHSFTCWEFPRTQLHQSATMDRLIVCI